MEIHVRDFSFSVEKYFTVCSKPVIFLTQEEKFFVSKKPCNIVLFYQVNTNEIPIETYFTSAKKGAIH